jgi:flagellar P-ring protein FlgI
LSAADNNVYAIAQGPVSQGNTGVRGASSKTIAIAKAATVEREFAINLLNNGKVELSLRNADFTTASRVTKAINESFREFVAEAENAGLIRVRVPLVARGSDSFPLVAFLSQLEQISVDADRKAIVVINERTGTIVSGGDVTLDPVAISHGNLQIVVKDKINRVGEIKKTTTVSELVTALNALGAGPRDLIAIFQALDAAHSLKAELKIL